LYSGADLRNVDLSYLNSLEKWFYLLHQIQDTQFHNAELSTEKFAS